MSQSNSIRNRAWLTLAVALYEALHLAWEYTHSGVASHHLLNRADMPAFSNWWGLILLPVLGWFLFGRMQARASLETSAMLSRPIALRLLAALLYGAGLATFFVLKYESGTTALFFGMFALAVLLPVYRAEYVLGFVLGMTPVFGAVLPTLIFGVFAVLSAVLHPCARFIVRKIKTHLFKSHARQPT